MEGEGALLDRAQGGDLDAFEALLEPLVEPACQLAYVILRDWQEAEDAVQEASLNAWRAMGRYRDDTGSIRAWYLTIVANQARSVRRRRWWSVVRLPQVWAGDGGDGPEDVVSRSADLERAMTSLREGDRLLLLLHFYLDLPFAEVARVVGLSEQAVRSRTYRATRSLRPLLQAAEEVSR